MVKYYRVIVYTPIVVKSLRAIVALTMPSPKK